MIRYDRGEIRSWRRTSQGGIVVEGYPTRTGRLRYVDPSGRERWEYRPPDEVFRADSLASMEHAPVTDGHPPELVTSENYTRYSRGHGSAGRRDGELVACTLVVQDAGLIAKIEAGTAELSCGYELEHYDETPGHCPEGRYDGVQRGIKYNHIAVVDKGRAGRVCRIRTDGDQETPTPHPEEHMITIRIDGVEYPLGTEAEQRAAAAAYQRHEATQASRITELTATGERAAARADAAEARVTEMTARLDAAPAEQNRAVAQHVAAIDAARRAGVEVRIDTADGQQTMSVDAIRKAVIAKIYPKRSIEGRSDAYVEALYETALERIDEDAAGAADARRADAPPPVREDGSPVRALDPVEESRRLAAERGQNAWRRSGAGKDA